MGKDKTAAGKPKGKGKAAGAGAGAGKAEGKRKAKASAGKSPPTPSPKTCLLGTSLDAQPKAKPKKKAKVAAPRGLTVHQRGEKILKDAQAAQTAVTGGVMKLVLGDKKPGHEKKELDTGHHQHRARLDAVVARDAVAMPDIFVAPPEAAPSSRLHTLYDLQFQWKGEEKTYTLRDLQYDLAYGFLKFVPLFFPQGALQPGQNASGSS
jgi:hypothetical protein